MRALYESSDSLLPLANGTFLRSPSPSPLPSPQLLTRRSTRFTTTPPLSDPDELVCAVRRAVIEVHTLALNSCSRFIAYTGPVDLTRRVRVAVAADGSATLLFPGGVEAAIVAGGIADEEGKEEVEEEEGEKEVDAAGWTQMRISEDVLFDVVRRVVQLTGRRIPDPVVSRVATVGDLRMFFFPFSPCGGGGLTGWRTQWSTLRRSRSRRS